MANELTPYDVVVIGAGASGTIVTAQLRRKAPEGARLALIDGSAKPAHGAAYNTEYESHLLNVPAGNMSAFPDDMENFLRWLKVRMPEADGKTFAPRKLYGDYLTEILDRTLEEPSPVELVLGMTVGMTRVEGDWAIRLEDGRTLRAKQVVVAVGNTPPMNPTEVGKGAMRHYWRNPWASDVTANLAADAPVLIIGTGLTMVDVVLALRETGHRGPITAVSHNGRMYFRHKAVTPRPLANFPEGLETPARALRWIRREVDRAESEGGDWRAVTDSLRPYTARIWQSWTPSQRATFLRHGRNLWDIRRHRIPAQVAEQMDGLMADGTLTIRSGRILELVPSGDGIDVRWRPRKSETVEVLHAARVVNCTGPDRDYARSDAQLIVSGREEGWLTPDALKLGFVTNAEGQLLDRQGNAVPGVYTLGPPRIAGLWESVAMPEIRVQAEKLGTRLAKGTEKTEG